MKETLEKILNFWPYLSEVEKQEIVAQTFKVNYESKKIFVHGKDECKGLMIVNKGRARIYINSDNGSNGGEITLYRLLDGDVCILSAACMMKSLDISVSMELEEDTEFFILPKGLFLEISNNNIMVKNYLLEEISDKFSSVIWVLNQYIFTKMAHRLASALIEHRALGESDDIEITHDTLARDLGTAREVVTRLLKQFQNDELVELSRGRIKILDINRLMRI
ncbi:MAG: Crp/Fnr family transcriptional regulator [Peptostreptococcaceae bacterium]|nr:Crp/Fnr family transcriptional regulator [Peptostreptococcaceae bacterium]